MKPIKVDSREELLAAVLPHEVHRTSVWPNGTTRPCVYRFADSDGWEKLKQAEADAYWKRGRYSDADDTQGSPEEDPRPPGEPESQ